MNASVQPALRAHRGVATMETVILCVLIAAACVLAVIVFGHTVWRGFDTAKGATAGFANESGQAAQEYRGQAVSDGAEAVKFPENFSDMKGSN